MPNGEMSSFLADLAGEVTQTLEAKRTQQQNRHAIEQDINLALNRTFQFFNALVKHLNTLEPNINRAYSFDSKAQFSSLKWKKALVEYRKQGLDDNALLDHVFFQVKMASSVPVVVVRRWEQFQEVSKGIQKFGLKPKEDLQDVWRNRTQKPTFEIGLEPEFIIRMCFQADYAEGVVILECGNLEGFGELKAKLSPQQLSTAVLEDFGRYLMGRSTRLPTEIQFTPIGSVNI